MAPYSKEDIGGWMIYLKTTHHWLSNVLQHFAWKHEALKKASHPKLLIKKNATRRIITVTFFLIIRTFRTYSTVTKF